MDNFNTGITCTNASTGLFANYSTFSSAVLQLLMVVEEEVVVVV
jgi:hypothetical protein